MRKITIQLSDALYSELAEVSAGVREHGYSADMWAAEAVESALAARRLPKVPPGKHGPHTRKEIEIEAEPEPYRVLPPPREGVS